MSVFNLPASRTAKSTPSLISRDEEQFAAISRELSEQRDVSAVRLAAAERAPAGPGGQAVERDVQIRALRSRRNLLDRFGIDMCLGRMVQEGSKDPIYIGRMGLASDDGERLLVDWRTPSAEPFFAATHADPHGLVSRRRYRWKSGSINDYWDEAFTPDALAHSETLDDQSAFVASLATSRSPHMRDVLSTIQADQDAIIRGDSQGALVVDGGPGTGKTVVALHRAAYLMYADPQLRAGRGGMLFVGPSDAYLSYVDDVLPSLGENSVQMTTLDGLVPESSAAAVERDERVRSLKESVRLINGIDELIRLHQTPPARSTVIETDWSDVVVSRATWSAAFDTADSAATHNENREEVWDALIDLIARRNVADFGSLATARRLLGKDADLRRAFDEAWPELDGAALLRELLASPRLLSQCVPGLIAEEVALLQREESAPFTDVDLALIDAARLRVGRSTLSHTERERAVVAASERAFRADAVDSLLAANDDPGLLTMLRADDADHYFADESVLPDYERHALDGPFAHIVVDEAQELTDAQWQMMLARCPSRSFTIVGDRAQARHGFTETWRQRLERVGLRNVSEAGLSINYRTPAEIMAVAAPEILAALPTANVPTSIREGGAAVRYGSVGERDEIIRAWLDTHDEGVAAVIGDGSFADTSRVRSLSPIAAKGLEFDLVIVVRPGDWGDDITGAVDRYVAMTRATNELVVLT